MIEILILVLLALNTYFLFVVNENLVAIAEFIKTLKK